jgi:uncharacterized protein
VTLLELSDVMDRPRLFSTFMLWLLAQLYTTLPEAGDLPKPKLCFFFDEAHLLFDDASDALLEQIERTARMIRSKGVGVYFVTQSPTDVPSSVLGQLGNRVQHALRAFTPEDADDLKKTVRTFPMTDFFDVGRTLTSLGIGEALITVLTPNGVPTPLAATRLVPPDSLMAALPPDRVAAIAAASPLATKYGTPVDPDSAHEMITRRIQAAKASAAGAAACPGSSAPSVDGSALMSEAALQREIAKRQRELERDRKAAEKETRARERERSAANRAGQRQQEQVIRAGTRVVTSRAGQDAIRSIFGTLFGGSGKR